MEKIFTFKEGLLKLFVLVALLVGGGSSAMAAFNQSLKGTENVYDFLTALGWEVENGRWNFYGDGIYDYANATGNTDLVTPKITASSNLQTLTITGYSGSDNVRVKIYISTDEKQTWTEVEDLTDKFKATGWDPQDITTKEFQVEGDYYVKIECFYVFFTNIKATDISTDPEMTVYSDNDGTVATNGKTTDFGLVTTAPSYTYYVKNTNRGTLYVEAEANGGYSVNPTKFALEAGQQQEVTVTAPANGDSEGTLTLTGMNGEEVLSTFTANFKGDVMDKEGKFFEDFVDEYRPVTSSDLPGWDLDLSVTGSTDGFGRLMFYNSTLYEYANKDESKYAITPKLTIKGENDVFYFNAYKRNGSSDAIIIVSYSADKESWTSVKSFTYSEFTTSAKTYSFKGIPSGNYYVKFEICDIAIDWVYGFVLAPETESLVLDETAAPTALAKGVQDVVLKYTAKAGWNTIALPFNVSDLSIFGTGAKAYELKGYQEGALQFSPATTLEASKPYVLYVETPAEANGNYLFEAVDVTETDPATIVVGNIPMGDYAQFFATYAPMAAGTMTGKYGVVPSTGKIQKGGASATMKGFRAYFQLPAGANNARMIIDGEEVTSISAINAIGQDNNAAYNLNGQRVNRTAKGIYIVNGKKIVVK